MIDIFFNYRDGRPNRMLSTERDLIHNINWLIDIIGAEIVGTRRLTD